MMEEELIDASCPPPPYTISDGRQQDHQPPPKNPYPGRPIQAFGEYPPGAYGSGSGYVSGHHMPPGHLPPGGMSGYHGYQPGYGYMTNPPYPSYPPYHQGGHAPFYPAHQMPPRPQQQQQQSVVVVNGGTPQVNQPIMVVQSFVGQLFLACFVLWFCGFLFGTIAFVLAIIASNYAHRDPMMARIYGRASVWVSVAGIVVFICVLSITVGLIGAGYRAYQDSRKSYY